MRAVAIVGCVLAMPFVTPAAGRVESLTEMLPPLRHRGSTIPVTTARSRRGPSRRDATRCPARSDRSCSGSARTTSGSRVSSGAAAKAGPSATSCWSAPIPPKRRGRLNRWGYIAEDVEGADGSLLALMTGADEGSYNEAASNTSRPPAAGDFRAIHARVPAWGRHLADRAGHHAVSSHRARCRCAPSLASARKRLRPQAGGCRSRRVPVPAFSRRSPSSLICRCAASTRRRTDARCCARASSTCSARALTSSTSGKSNRCAPTTRVDPSPSSARRSRFARSQPTNAPDSRSLPAPTVT